MGEPEKILLVFGVLIGVVIILTLIWYKKGGNRRETLRVEYEEALKGTDKRAALEAGRKYYAELRYGRLTIYDEQAIANDINTMKV
jgi:hypothetical protein